VPIALPTKTATPLKTAAPQDPVFVPSDALAHNMISAPKPIYPPMARFQKEEGNVILQALISEAGTVESVGVVSGPAALRNAAVDALRSWRYTPYLIDGRPVKVRTYVNFHFAMAR
jgi:protein TonB